LIALDDGDRGRIVVMTPHGRRIAIGLLGLTLSCSQIACVEPTQAAPPKDPAAVLLDKRCGEGHRPVQAPVGGRIHPKEAPPPGQYPRPFDEDPLCAGGGTKVWIEHHDR
jgi:hypothetical protein